MSLDVSMPQLGESIAEGTLVRWYKKVGERVERDEILFEISTDKVDTEIPAPDAGYLERILVEEGETVPVHTVVCRIAKAPPGVGAMAAGDGSAADGGRSGAPPPREAPPRQRAAQPAGVSASVQGTPPRSAAPGGPDAAGIAGTAETALVGGVRGVQAPRREVPSSPSASLGGTSVAAPRSEDNGGIRSAPDGSQAIGAGGLERTERTSPLVRRLAAEAGVRVADIRGTGIGGRVTRDDILRHVEEERRAVGAGEAVPGTAPAGTGPGEGSQGGGTEPGRRAVGTSPGGASTGRLGAAPPDSGGDGAAASGDRLEPLTPMRQQIAEHLLRSVRTAVHATTVVEVDMTQVRELKNFLSARFDESRNVRLTYLPFIVQAVCKALRKFPVMNASLEDRMVRYHADVNMGIAVALDDGLIVPVIRRADSKDLLEIAAAIQDLARRARVKELNPEDVQGGTFTITNPGVFGSIIGTPVLHQPQVGILYVGAVQKRPVVLPDSDAIAVRSMAYFCLTLDHRLIDGAVADRFLSSIKGTLESGSFDGVPRWR